MKKKNPAKGPVNFPRGNSFLLILSAALSSIIVFGSVLLSQNTIKNTVQPNKDVLAAIAPTPKIPTPQLKEGSILPTVTAKSYYAIDMETGTALLAKDEDEPSLPASTTKMATALVAMSYYKPDDILVVPNINVVGQKIGLVPGEKITAQNLLYGMLIFSGNDAAEVLAANYPGGRANFINAMNQQAKNLGLVHTHFTNPVGLDEYLHFSTSKDLVTLAQHAVENPLFAKIVATKNYQVTNTDGTIIHQVENTNELVDKMPGIIGVKTGWTENSGEDLVALYDHNGHKVMLSVLGSKDRFGETETLLNWIFDNYKWE